MNSMAIQRIVNILLISISLNANNLLVLSAGEDKSGELLDSMLTRPGSVHIMYKNIVPTNGTTTGTSSDVRAIRFDGELIHRYIEVNNTFVTDSNSPQRYSDTRERIPANITGAFTGPDKDIYFFRGNQFCKRQLHLQQNVTNDGCGQWYDNRQLFGCHSDAMKNQDICANSTVEGVSSNKLDPSGRQKYIFKGTSRWLLTIGADYITGKLTQMCKTVIVNKRRKTESCNDVTFDGELNHTLVSDSNSSQGNGHDKKALVDLCSDLNIGDLDRSWQREDTVYVWRGKKFWKIADFPRAPRVVQSGNTSSEWDGFSDDPDAVVIIQEGKKRRGFVFAFFGGYWSAWYPTAKPWINYKAWWGQPTGSMKFGATMHNGDIKNPLVLGFDGSQVHTYASTGTLLEPRTTTFVNKTEENWPKDITAAVRMADNTVYLFRGEKYCKRGWKCNDGDCCNEWKNAMNLFHCPETKESESRNPV